MAEAIGIISGILQISHSSIVIVARMVGYCDEFRSFNRDVADRIASIDMAFRSLKDTLEHIHGYASDIPYPEIRHRVYRTLEELVQVLQRCEGKLKLFKKEAKAVSKKTGIAKLVKHQFVSSKLDKLWGEILAYLPLLQESKSSLHTMMQIEANTRLKVIEQYLSQNAKVSMTLHIENSKLPDPFLNGISRESPESPPPFETVDPARRISTAPTSPLFISDPDPGTGHTIAPEPSDELSAVIKKGDLSELQHLSMQIDPQDLLSWISTALLLSCRHRKRRLVKALLDSQLVPNYTPKLDIFDSTGLNPLHNSLGGFRDDIEVLQLVVDAGYDVNSPDTTSDRHTPLHHAVIKGKLDSTTYLLQKGATVDAVDGRAITPLEYAVTTTNPNLKLISVLLRNEATFGRRLRPVVGKSIWRKNIDALLDAEEKKPPLSTAKR